MDTVDGYDTYFQQAVEMIGKEYNSVVRQNKVKIFRRSLRMSTYVVDGMNMADNLERVYKTITKLSGQALNAHRGEAHKVEFLCTAVTGYGLARDP